MLKELGLTPSDVVVIVVAGTYMIERFFYWVRRKKTERYNETKNDFENLLNDFNQIRNNVSHEVETSQYLRLKDERGMSAGQQEEKVKHFRVGLAAFNDLGLAVSKQKTRNNWIDSEGRRCLDEDYKWQHTLMDHNINHYFVFICNLINQIETDKIIKEEDKSIYMKRLQWALSAAELVVIYYYGMGETSLSKKMRDYAITYNLFQFLPSFFREDLPENQIRFYKMD